MAGYLEAGETKLRLALTVTQSEAGTYAGNLDSLDQGSTIPIGTITVDTDAVCLEITSVANVIEGILNKERTELAGKFTQSGKTHPLTFMRGGHMASGRLHCHFLGGSRVHLPVQSSRVWPAGAAAARRH